MKIQTSTREDGLTLITAEMPASETVTCQITFRAGARWEDPEKWGLAHFFEHMLFKQTKRFKNSKELSGVIDEIGAINNAYTWNEVVSVWIKTSKSNVEKAWEVNSELVCHPLFPAEEIEKEKGVVIEEIRMYEDMPESWLERRWGDWFLQRQKPLLNCLGEEETVKKITRDDVANHWKKTFVPKNGVSVMAGGITHEEHLRLAEKWLEFENEGERLKDEGVDIEKLAKEKVMVLSRKEVKQANLELGTSLEGAMDQDVVALRILGAILDGGMSTRLFQEVREKNHLCYSVHESRIHFSDFGIWDITGGMNVEKTEKAVKVILGEIKKLREELVSEEELKKAKTNLEGKLAIAFEGSHRVSDRASLSFLATGKVKTLKELLKENEEVTSEDVMRVAKKWLDTSRLRLGVIGPFEGEEMKEKLEKIMSEDD